MNSITLDKHPKAFYTIDEFPKFKVLEENYEVILNEYLNVAEIRKKENYKDNIFEPWVEKNLYEESNDNGWDVAPIMIGGSVIEERCKKFPKLYQLTSGISGVVSISYSLLKPGTHIVPHKGYDEYSEKVLRYHMGIIIPEGDIGIRVDKELKSWSNGKSFIFDDYLIHEAWNFSKQDRLVLIIDFLKEINEEAVFKDKNFNNSIKTYFKN